MREEDWEEFGWWKWLLSPPLQLSKQDQAIGKFLKYIWMKQAPLVFQEYKNHKLLENTGPSQKDGLKDTFLCYQKSFSRVV